MPTNMLKFPAVYVVDGIISFFQYIFGLPGLTDVNYRWNSDERKSKIWISAPYTVDREKIGSAPSITISRGSFNFQNRVIDNLAKANANTKEQPVFRDLMSGNISIICESRSAAEASGIANFCAIQIQSERHKIMSQLKFIQDLKYVDIGTEIPIKEAAEIKRFQCVVTLSCNLYIGWIKDTINNDKFNKANIYTIDKQDTYTSPKGEIVQGSPNLIDTRADFGTLDTNNPQLIESEYNKKWYYVLFTETNKKYTIEEIVNNKTLRLSQVDENGNTIAFNPDATVSGITYRIVWNSIHINMELPTNNN